MPSAKLAPGFYTICYPSGDYRTIRVKIVKDGPLQGKVILSFKEMGSYVGFGFLNPDGSVKFWKRFKQNNSEVRLQRIRLAIRIIVRAPEPHALIFAEKERCCSRCGRKLTVPASLYRGRGPECAGKTHWNKSDNQAAFDGMRPEARA
jgi:hypothetical protein